MDLIFRPSYLSFSSSLRQSRISLLKEFHSPCRLCPRQCGALRAEGRSGVCQAQREVKIASHNLHMGEEPPITGSCGSGTIFFSGCTLKCVFCQNYPISHLFNGTVYTIEQLARIMLNLQKRGAHNINLVSPTPYLYHFVAALDIAAQNGLNIPIAYNTSGYERPEIIRLLDGLIDIYMPDIKYVDENLPRRFSGVSDYFQFDYPAVMEMFDQVGELQTDPNGVAQRGLIIRHLILPGEIENSKAVLKIIADSPFKTCHLSLMSQYFPAYKAADTTGINRRLTEAEYEEVKDFALRLGLETGWFQDLDGS